MRAHRDDVWMSSDILQTVRRQKGELLGQAGENDFGFGDGEELTHATARTLDECEEIFGDIRFVIQKPFRNPLLQTGNVREFFMEIEGKILLLPSVFPINLGGDEWRGP